MERDPAAVLQAAIRGVVDRLPDTVKDDKEQLPEFQQARYFTGSQKGYYFGTGEQGTGWAVDHLFNSFSLPLYDCQILIMLPVSTCKSNWFFEVLNSIAFALKCGALHIARLNLRPAKEKMKLGSILFQKRQYYSKEVGTAECLYSYIHCQSLHMVWYSIISQAPVVSIQIAEQVNLCVTQTRFVVIIPANFMDLPG